MGGCRMKTLLAFLLLSATAYGQWFTDVDMIAMQIQAPTAKTDGNDFGFSERVEAGYQFEQCGLRARFWHFDDNYVVSPQYPRQLGIELDTLDFEATKQVGDFAISGGIRVVDWRYTSTLINPPFIEPSYRALDDSYGVTLAAEGNTALCAGESWRLAAVYGGRISLLTGEWHADPGFSQSLVGYGRDTQDILECWTGIEARYGCAFARATLEMQRWQSNALQQDFTYFGALGLLGIGTTVGVTF